MNGAIPGTGQTDLELEKQNSFHFTIKPSVVLKHDEVISAIRPATAAACPLLVCSKDKRSVLSYAERREHESSEMRDHVQAKANAAEQHP